MKDLLTKALAFIVARLQEKSTWQGIFALLTAGGIAIDPSMADKITAAGLTIIGLIHIAPDSTTPTA